jgi:hypothetical protein
MSVAAPAPDATADPPAEPVPDSGRATGRRWHLAVAVLALGLAFWVTQGLWSDPYSHVLAQNRGDQAFFEWLLGYGVYILGHGADPFFTTLLNAPNGVNLAANTSITVDTVLFSPLTLLAGPQVSFVAILTLNLAGTAFAWYLFLARWLVKSRAAAAVAGLFCGFAPGMISHANGHLNFTSGWVAPLVLWWVLKLREPGRWLRNGLVLGVLLGIGFSIAAEGLFFTALASAVFVVTWSLSRATRAEARAAAPTVLAALGVAAVVAGALLAYPLYMHFDGPQTFSGTGFNQRHYVEDVAAYISFSSRSLAAWAGLDSAYLASNPTEETSFFGLPLMVLVIGSLVMLWRRADPGRRATLRALTVVGALFMVLSWGPRLQILENETSIWLPYAALAHLPLFDSALPARFALALIGVIGIVLALAADRLLTEPLPSVGTHTAFAAAFAVALVPLIPQPLLTADRAPEPAFIANGTWKRYVPEGGALTALPIATNAAADGQRWQAYSMGRGGRQFRTPGGYFLGPGPLGKKGTGKVGAPWRHTDWILFRAAVYGYVSPITDQDRQQARRDLAYWDVDAVFLADQLSGANGTLFRAALEITARNLLGPPERVEDVLVWRIRPGVDPVTPVRKATLGG